jgi:hypothetical protein
MSINPKLDRIAATGTASAAVTEGRFLIRSGAKTVAQASAVGDATGICVGISATSAAGANDELRLYQPGDVARVQAGGDLNPATAAHCFLTNDADGKAVAATANDRIMAFWLRAAGEDPAADEFITVLITDQTKIQA